MPPENEELFLPDRAIESEDQDEFGHAEYVDSLERFLHNVDAPWHIGIFGEWGAGKTSIIKMLFSRLRNKDEFEDSIFVEFDAWSHAEGSIRTELLLELDQQIGKQIGKSNGVLTEEEITGRLYDVEEEEIETEQGFWEGFIEFVTDETHIFVITIVLAILAGGFAFFGMPEASIAVLTLILAPLFVLMAEQLSDATDTLQKKFLHPRKEWSGSYQRIFEDIIDGSDAETIVISIDNLDRCESSTVYDVLVSLKTFMENDNCIYLIPCDDKALESHIKSIDKGDYFETEKNEREFLRKFFQTHIRIPPFLPEDIEEYASNESKRLSKTFEDETLDVIANAYIDNPRRIKHALNRLSTLRVLAEEVEETGALTEGRVTNHIPFLAKISILEEEYPEFYEILSENPRLLEDINGYFSDQLTDSDRRKRVESVLETTSSGQNGEKETRLEAFLRSTRRIQVENPDPFLNLSEPSYATSLSDVDTFLQNLKTGQADEVRKELQQVDEHGHYVDAIGTAFESYTTRRREQPLFGSIDTTISIFDEFDQKSQNQLINLIEQYLTTDIGQSFLIDLDPQSVFPVILQMQDHESRTLLQEYVELVSDEKKLRENVLQTFVDYADEIPTRIVQEVSKEVEIINDDDFKRALKIIDSSEDAELFTSTDLLERSVSLIELKSKKTEFSNIEYYTMFDDVATDSARGTYVLHLLDVRDDYSSNQAQKMDETLSERLLEIKGDVLHSDAKDILKNVQEKVESKENQQPVSLVEICFHFYDSFSNDTRQEFHSWISELLKNWNPNTIEQLFDLGSEHGVPLIQTEEEVDAILKRIPRHIDDETVVVEKIVPTIPKEYDNQLAEKVKKIVKSNNNNHSQLGIKIFTEYPERFESDWNNLIEVLGDQANKESNVRQKRWYLEAGSEIFSELDSPEKESYLSQMDDLLGNDRNEFKLYRDLWDEIKGDLDSDRKETVAGDVRDALVQAFSRDQNPNHLDPLIEVLSALTEYLEESNGQRFMERLSKQLTENNFKDSQKAKVLEHLMEFNEFYKKEDQILDRVESLLKQTSHNNVKQNSEKLLDQFEELEEADPARINQLREDYLSE